MPTRDAVPAGAPTWIELFTNDVDAARTFYPGLFGWTAGEQNPDFGGYSMFFLGDAPIAGCMGNDDPEHPADFWSTYLNVADAEATMAKAVEAGGQTILAPMAIADLGHMAVLADPSGAAIGLWQPVEFTGIGVLAEHGAPAWFELHTMGYDAVIPFYRDVFGWDVHAVSDIPEFRYSTFGEGEAGLAGIMDDSVHAPEGSPSFWTVYIAVDDADAIAAKAVELGGTVEVQPENTPYGRLAVLTDTTGSRFSIMGENT